jgi:endonuclease G, mitochondrial
MSSEKSARVTSFLEWIAPEGGLESMGRPSVLDGIEETPWSTEPELERATEAVGRLERGESLSDEGADALEAIVLPKERPVVDIVNGTYAVPAAPFEHLGESAARASIEAAISSIGRIELPGHPSLPFAGTGFVVGEGVLMTNRHVAELFAVGIGREELSFRPGQSAAIDFLRERGREDSLTFRIARVVMVHPYWDMALLIAEGLDGVPPLRLSTAPPGDLREREIVVIGYPALDPRNNVDLQNRIFGSTFNIKRLQPGRLRQPAEIRSFGHMVPAVTHDSSTLGGNSGSAVIDVETGTVSALHFAGRYLEANYAVPAYELALDRRVVEAAVNFDGDAAGSPPPAWSSFWEEADPAGPAGRIATASDAATEALVEPFRDEDLSARRGYDDRFLGIRVTLPTVHDESLVSHLDDGSHVLPYEHFSVVLNKDRRLAQFTASNVDADPRRKEPEPGRDYTRKGLTGLRDGDLEKWFIDPRIPAIHQLPDRFFTKDRASFDKGHIVRREDVAWGDSFEEVRRGNGDTYHVTNCSPQVADFNRSTQRGVWGQLENLVLGQAKTEKYSIFAGPVFRSDDRLFRGVDDSGVARVAIPRQFWKIVVARSGDELQTFAFLLDQDLSDTDLEFAVDQAWRSRMISVADLEELVGTISFPDELRESDQIDAGAGQAVRAEIGLETVR